MEVCTRMLRRTLWQLLPHLDVYKRQVVANSFNGNTEKPYLSWGGFSLRWYVHLFQNGPLLASFGNTMLLAITTVSYTHLVVWDRQSVPKGHRNTP